MVILPVLEMVLRKVLGSGVPGGTVYVQHLTLWLGFLGALGATSAGKHLGLAWRQVLRRGRGLGGVEHQGRHIDPAGEHQTVR